MAIPERFRVWAPRMMRDLIEDFDLTEFQAAGIVGNGGQESAGFEIMQEIKPTVPGSRGGLGGFQWTGSRRVDFEKWLARNKDKKWTAHTYEANYSMLFRELVGPEKKALEAVRDTTSIEEATEVFCKTFERPGIFHMDDRMVWARRALELYRDLPAEPDPDPQPDPEPVPTVAEQLLKMEDLILTFFDSMGSTVELLNAKDKVIEARMWAQEHLRKHPS